MNAIHQVTSGALERALLAGALLLFTFAVATAIATNVGAIHYVGDYRHEDADVEYVFHTRTIPGSWESEISDAADIWDIVTDVTIAETTGIANRYILKGGVSAGNVIAEVTGTTIGDHVAYRQMTFNEDKSFDTSCNGSTNDVFTVALHEFGHFAGNLEDIEPEVPEDPVERLYVMYGAMPITECDTTITTHDRDTMDELYDHVD